MFRIIGLFVKSLFLQKLSMNDNCMLTLRVWPTDMDLNFHRITVNISSCR
jgi:hypothetical protein